MTASTILLNQWNGICKLQLDMNMYDNMHNTAEHVNLSFDVTWMTYIIMLNNRVCLHTVYQLRKSLTLTYQH